MAVSIWRGPSEICAQLGLDPGRPAAQEVFQHGDLGGVRIVQGRELRPAAEVSIRGVTNLARQAVNEAIEVVWRELTVQQRREARPVSRPEVGIAKEEPPPSLVEVIGRIPRLIPLLGFGCARVVRSPQAAIEIPHRARRQATAALLVKVRAEAQAIDVLGQRVDDVVVDPGIDVDELRVMLAGGGMLEIRGSGGLPEAVDVATDEVELRP